MQIYEIQTVIPDLNLGSNDAEHLVDSIHTWIIFHSGARKLPIALRRHKLETGNLKLDALPIYIYP